MEVFVWYFLLLMICIVIQSFLTSQLLFLWYVIKFVCLAWLSREVQSLIVMVFVFTFGVKDKVWLISTGLTILCYFLLDMWFLSLIKCGFSNSYLIEKWSIYYYRKSRGGPRHGQNLFDFYSILIFHLQASCTSVQLRSQ